MMMMMIMMITQLEAIVCSGEIDHLEGWSISPLELYIRSVVLIVDEWVTSNILHAYPTIANTGLQVASRLPNRRSSLFPVWIGLDWFNLVFSPPNCVRESFWKFYCYYYYSACELQSSCFVSISQFKSWDKTNISICNMSSLALLVMMMISIITTNSSWTNIFHIPAQIIDIHISFHISLSLLIIWDG